MLWQIFPIAQHGYTRTAVLWIATHFYGGSIKNNRDYIYDVYFEDILSNVVFPQPPELEDGILYNLHVDISSVPEETVAFYVLINFKFDGDLCLTSHDSTSALNDDGQATLKIYYSLQYKQGPIQCLFGGSISDLVLWLTRNLT